METCDLLEYGNIYKQAQALHEMSAWNNASHESPSWIAWPNATMRRLYEFSASKFWL